MSPPEPAPAAPRLWDRLTALIAPAHFKLGLRAALAGLVAYVVGFGLDLPNAYWAVLTAVLVVQATIGASLSVALDRALGTVAGGVIGVLAATLAGVREPYLLIGLGIALFLASSLSARSASFKLAPPTVVIVMLTDPGHVEPWVSGLHRIMEIGVGGVIGMACSLLILPERALLRLFPHCATALRICGQLTDIGGAGILGRGVDAGAIDRLNSGARVALRAADARITEALREQVGRFSGTADPAPVVRSCRRLWHSVIILLRSADRPMAAAVAERFGPAVDAAVTALSAQMGAMADRLEGVAVADYKARAAAVRDAVAALEAQAERLNAEGGLEAAGADTLTAVFTAVSACNHMAENLEDVAARFDELQAALRL